MEKGIGDLILRTSIVHKNVVPLFQKSKIDMVFIILWL